MAEVVVVERNSLEQIRMMVEVIHCSDVVEDDDVSMLVLDQVSLECTVEQLFVEQLLVALLVTLLLFHFVCVEVEWIESHR